MGDMASRPFFSLIGVSSEVLLALCYGFMVFKFNIFIRVSRWDFWICFTNVLNLNMLMKLVIFIIVFPLFWINILKLDK